MSGFKDIRAVTFDVGGTLIEPWPSVGHVYAEIAARHGYGDISPEELTRRFMEAWRARADFGYTRTEWAALVDATFGGLVPEPPNRTFFPALYEHFGRAGAWRIYDDVLPVLETLAASGLRLAIISNWDERLRPLLHELDLARHFEVITISCEAGCAKPAREIFALAAHSLSLPPSRILHVGDGVREDVKGAKAAGFNAVHVVRGTNGKTGAGLNILIQTVL